VIPKNPAMNVDELRAMEEAFLTRAYFAAQQSAHIFPDMAACEAALESSYGRSALAIDDNNLFGMKQHQHVLYGTHILPTREFLNSKWVTVGARWVKYPGWRECFDDRMATLRRLSTIRDHNGVLEFPHYDAALGAGNAAGFVIEVSRTWSTDPQRAKKVIDIRLAHIGLFNRLMAATTLPT
jgi:flagellum-specific peptidoglycan hydrolase FlgJ